MRSGDKTKKKGVKTSPVVVVVVGVVVFAHTVAADRKLVGAVLVTVVPRLRYIYTYIREHTT